MADFKEIKDISDLEGILEESHQRKVIIFKHSTACPISSHAWQAVQNFIQERTDNTLVVMIKVIESRPLSNLVADNLRVKHQSPQVLLLSEGQVMWHASHQTITQSNINKALEGEGSLFNLNL